MVAIMVVLSSALCYNITNLLASGIGGSQLPATTLRGSMKRCAFRILCRLLVIWLSIGATAWPVGADDMPARAHVRLVTDSHVAPERRNALVRLAGQLRVRIDQVVIGTRDGDVRPLLAGPDLVILDARSADGRKDVQEHLVPALTAMQTPWLLMGSGRPEFGNMAPLHARRLVAHFAAGGAANLKQVFGYLAAWRAGEPLAGFLTPIPFPPTGIYHPSAPGPFASEASFFEWGQGRWKNGAARVAIAVGVEMIANLQTDALDRLIEVTERRGMIPIAFWLDSSDPDRLRRFLLATKAEEFLITKCAADPPALEAASLALGIRIVKIAGAEPANNSGCGGASAY